jgi:hypothetical protein
MFKSKSLTTYPRELCTLQGDGDLTCTYSDSHAYLRHVQSMVKPSQLTHIRLTTDRHTAAAVHCVAVPKSAAATCHAASCCVSGCARAPGSAGDTASWKCGLETSTLLFVQLCCDVVHRLLPSRALLQERCVNAGSRLWCDCLRPVSVDCKLNIATVFVYSFHARLVVPSTPLLYSTRNACRLARSMILTMCCPWLLDLTHPSSRSPYTVDACCS